MQKRENERLNGCFQYTKNGINSVQYIPVHNKAQKHIYLCMHAFMLDPQSRPYFSFLIKHLIKMLLSIRRKTQQCCLPKNRSKTQNSEVAYFRDFFFSLKLLWIIIYFYRKASRKPQETNKWTNKIKSQFTLGNLPTV